MRISRLIAVGMLIYALICFAGCSPIDAGNELISNITNSTKLTVPDFKGMLYEDIVASDDYSEFQLVAQYEISDTVPKGVVISQGIAAGKKISRDKSIMIYVSSGPELIQVPRIDGFDIHNAKLLLTKYGIKFREVPQSSESIPENVVIVTNPSAGSEILPDTVVDVYVSIGSQVDYAKVGKYVGLTEAEAKEAIEKDGFTLGEITYVDSKETVGTVLSQSIDADKTAEKGRAINITVSTGTPVYEYKLTVKNELLELIFDDDHKDMTLSLVVDGEVVQTTDEFDVNIRTGGFEFLVTGKSLNVTVTVRINFINGDFLDAFRYDVDFYSKTSKLSKNNDLYDYVIGVD